MNIAAGRTEGGADHASAELEALNNSLQSRCTQPSRGGHSKRDAATGARAEFDKEESGAAAAAVGKLQIRVNGEKSSTADPPPFTQRRSVPVRSSPASQRLESSDPSVFSCSNSGEICATVHRYSRESRRTNVERRRAVATD